MDFYNDKLIFKSVRCQHFKGVSDTNLLADGTKGFQPMAL